MSAISTKLLSLFPKNIIFLSVYCKENKNVIPLWLKKKTTNIRHPRNKQHLGNIYQFMQTDFFKKSFLANECWW